MDKVRPLLERLGQRLFVIGEDAASANLVKLAANVLTATTLECMGEVLALMRKGGVDGHVAFDVLTNSLFDSRVHKSYGQKIVDGRYIPPGMTAPLAIKDLRLARLARLFRPNFFSRSAANCQDGTRPPASFYHARGYPEDGAPTGKFGMELGYPMSNDLAAHEGKCGRRERQGSPSR